MASGVVFEPVNGRSRWSAPTAEAWGTTVLMPLTPSDVVVPPPPRNDAGPTVGCVVAGMVVAVVAVVAGMVVAVVVTIVCRNGSQCPS